MTELMAKEIRYPADVTEWGQKEAYDFLVLKKLGEGESENAMSVLASLGGRKFTPPEAELAAIDLDACVFADKVIIPAKYDTWSKRVNCLMLLREKQRRENNTKAAMYRAGTLSAVEWTAHKNSLTAKISSLSIVINEHRDTPPQSELDKVVIADVIKDKLTEVKL